MSHDVLAAEGAARSGGQALPLSLRIPNPPVGFVGRTAELRRLEVCLAEAPATVIVGPTGVGKTALALAALQDPRGLSGRPQAFIQVAALAPETLLLRLRKVLSLGERTPPDWGLLAAHPAEALATLIDLADAGGWRFLLDDADRADPAELDWLLEGVARYARRSRWLLTARDLTPGRAAGAALIALGPLAEAPLRRLAAAVAPGASAHQISAALAVAAGSPRALARQLLSANLSPDPAVSEAQALLQWFRRPLSLATLASLGLAAHDPALQALETRGALLRLPEGLLLRPPEAPAHAAGRRPAPDGGPSRRPGGGRRPPGGPAAVAGGRGRRSGRRPAQPARP